MKTDEQPETRCERRSEPFQKKSSALRSADMAQKRLTDQLAFLVEIDALKQVTRQSRIIGCSRRENSAEHSWHLAIFALVLADSIEDLDLSRVIAMLLVHDIVEVDAGDAPIHGSHNAAALAVAERNAAARIFGLLPDDQSKRFMNLWHEFEAAETLEARFAKALDRLQPLLLNTLTQGGTWAENGVTEIQVYQRYGPTIEEGSPAIWEFAKGLVGQYFAAAAQSPRD